MDVTPIAVAAAVWGAATGLLVPRAAYRLSVEPEDDWRAACPQGHPLTGSAGGWLGLPRCAACASGAPSQAPPRPLAAAPGTAAAPRRPGEPTPLPGEPQAVPGEPRPLPGEQGGGRPSTATPAHPGPAQPGPAHPEPGTRAPVAEAPTAADGPRRPVPYRVSVPVAVVTALVCLLLGRATGPRPELVVWLLCVPFAVLLALVDRNVHRLPDEVTLPLAAAAAILLGAAELAPGDGGSWPTALLGGLALGGVYFLLFLINPNGMGFGDVKLALALGVVLGWYGWTVLFAGAFAGFLLGAVYGVGLMLMRRANRRTAIPFGPFMITGAFLGLLLGALAAA
ncbi:prepilin peptidase [Streptomyces genisteinicus]|uniref:Prepilin peptidase n=1 Tax=Streptomyces genisteinicus TaxID=2768068 RepID=A0A7H0HWY6_9ACTN|nr:prepilin peptidase [Streptomyces genisteinicus]QNP65052.1 prepilin peptidase [Streptomyces genisteinicus]